MKRLSAFVLTAALLCAALAACAPSAADPGVTPNSTKIPVPSQWSDSYTGIFLDFAEDGTLHYIQNRAELCLPCEILDDSFIVSYDPVNREEIAYTLEGDNLTVTWADGAKTTLARQYD
jgi:hypothetical protein